MKSNTIVGMMILMLTFSANAQNDTMYVMKDGVVVDQYNVEEEIDSIIFYNPETNQEGENEETFTDPRDETVYKTVTIGEQVWMAENLKYLPSVNEWSSDPAIFPHYYVYQYSGTSVDDAKATGNYETYGVLYNWPAAIAGSSSSGANPSGVQGVCPTGWHLPSEAEWMELHGYLEEDVGGKLKETGNSFTQPRGLWHYPNTGATNETGFSARPGGRRNPNSAFIHMGENGYWWSATESSANFVNSYSTGYFNSHLSPHGLRKDLALSVRCVKD